MIDQIPTLGVIYNPGLKKLYYGVKGSRAFVVEGLLPDGDYECIVPRELGLKTLLPLHLSSSLIGNPYKLN
jgi:hypothetical protein